MTSTIKQHWDYGWVQDCLKYMGVCFTHTCSMNNHYKQRCIIYAGHAQANCDKSICFMRSTHHLLRASLVHQSSDKHAKCRWIQEQWKVGHRTGAQTVMLTQDHALNPPFPLGDVRRSKFSTLIIFPWFLFPSSPLAEWRCPLSGSSWFGDKPFLLTLLLNVTSSRFSEPECLPPS